MLSYQSPIMDLNSVCIILKRAMIDPVCRSKAVMIKVIIVLRLTSNGYGSRLGAGQTPGRPGVTLTPELVEELLHLLPVDDEAEDPHHSPLLVHQVLLHVVPSLGLGLPITGEVGLVAVYHRTVEDGGSVLDDKTVHRLLREDRQLGRLGFLLGDVEVWGVEDVI